METDDSLTNDEADDLLDQHRRVRDERRYRLLAAACLRRAVWELLIPMQPFGIEPILAAVEDYADSCNRNVILPARHQAKSLVPGPSGTFQTAAVLAALIRLTDDTMPSMTLVLRNVRDLYMQAGQSFALTEGQLNRDVFNPFGRPAYHLGERNETVLSLAQAAYTHSTLRSGELEHERLKVLSDALEEAGAEVDLLEHLRSPEPHIRGCWVLDLVLGL